jgi:hypothetical protein
LTVATIRNQREPGNARELLDIPRGSRERQGMPGSTGKYQGAPESAKGHQWQRKKSFIRLPLVNWSEEGRESF